MITTTSDIKSIDSKLFLNIINRDSETNTIVDNRVFLPSRSINVFPCSRRGQYEIEKVPKGYDPEARLNTERTNRLRTAINGFTDSFIVTDKFTVGDTLAFVLAGYRVEIKNFEPSDIASALGNISEGTIYAHLSLHTGISLGDSYSTEILYRQSTTTTDKLYLDVTHSANDKTADFFVGISFTNIDDVDDTLYGDTNFVSYDLPLFKWSGSTWELVQTSLLPKIEHGETEDSIKIKGNVSTPTLNVDTINGNSNDDYLVINADLTVTGTADVDILTVSGTNIDTSGISTVNVIADSAIITELYTGGMAAGENVGATAIGEIKAGKSIEAPIVNASTELTTKNLTASGEVKAPVFTQTIDNIDNPVPALELAHLTTTDTYQLRFKFGTPITIIEE